MSIDAYLSATYGEFDRIEGCRNRFPELVEVIRQIFGDDGIFIHFIRSQHCKSTIAHIGKEQHIVFDRQSDLYFNALAFAEIFEKENEDRFRDSLFGALFFIAGNELYYKNKPLLAKKIIEIYGFPYKYNQPADFFCEIARLNFTLFHEWGAFRN